MTRLSEKKAAMRLTSDKKQTIGRHIERGQSREIALKAEAKLYGTGARS